MNQQFKKMEVPLFKYEPMKVSSKRKVEMSSLGRSGKSIWIKFIISFLFAFITTFGIAYVIASLGRLYNF